MLQWGNWSGDLSGELSVRQHAAFSAALLRELVRARKRGSLVSYLSSYEKNRMITWLFLCWTHFFFYSHLSLKLERNTSSAYLTGQ